MMEGKSVVDVSQKLGGLSTFFRKCLFSVMSVGPIPKHVSFIMDGNRRFAKKRNMGEGEGHKAGYLALMTILRYCYELGVKYVTVYAFSIDNFKRRPDEIQILMDLLQEKIDGLLERESIVNQYGVRVYFLGNLKLLSEPVRVAAEKAMKATANNAKAMLLICVPYSSSDEIVNAVQESCNEKRNEIQALNGVQDSETLLQNIANVKVVDIERNMYMAVAPDPDIMIRTSGETRLSNFLLWQTSTCPLYFTSALWPELGLGHLVWAVLYFQRNHNYLEKKKKQL